MIAKDLVVGNLYIDIDFPNMPQKYLGINGRVFPGEHDFDSMICDDKDLKSVREYKLDKEAQK